MSGLRNLVSASILLASLVICSSSWGATITFDPLGGPNTSPYVGHVEGNFGVAPASGAWQQARFFGNPARSIFSNSVSASIDVTENTTGFFTFSSVDMVAIAAPIPPQSSVTYLFEGFLNNVLVFSQPGGPLPLIFTITPPSFTTIPSANSTQVLDKLTITMSRTLLTNYVIDNIVVNTAAPPVPEPTSMALFGLTALGFGVGFRRRRNNGEAIA